MIALPRTAEEWTFVTDDELDQWFSGWRQKVAGLATELVPEASSTAEEDEQPFFSTEVVTEQP